MSIKGKKMTIYLPGHIVEKLQAAEGETASKKIQNIINIYKEPSISELEIAYLRDFHQEVSKCMAHFFDKKYKGISFEKSTRGKSEHV